MVYITKTNFRLRTGVTSDEISDDLLDLFIQDGAYDIKRKCYALEKEELLTKKTVGSEERYYFKNEYLADGNLDDEITTDDLTILEINSSGTVRNDITNQIDTLNDNLGYITFNTGYPTDSNYKIVATYRWCNILYDEMDNTLELLNMYFTFNRCIDYILGELRSGETNKSICGLNISTDLNAIFDIQKNNKNKINEGIIRLKPLVSYNWRE